MFEWDDDKNAANLEKHGIRFEEVSSVFEDDYAIEQLDSLHPERFIRLGFSVDWGVLVVVFSEIGEARIRIISARRATKQEGKTYAQRI